MTAPSPAARLTREEYALDPEALARRLLGLILVHATPAGRRVAGRIVETEAYLGAPDRASHAFGGRRTPRVEPMYGPPGLAYVFQIYGMHDCFNVVCGPEGEPLAVLVRALEPVDGVGFMKRRRAGGRVPDARLCAGPGLLCKALGISRRYSGVDLVTNPRLWIERPAGHAPPPAARTPRIGVDYAGDWARAPLRWVLPASPSLSRAK